MNWLSLLIPVAYLGILVGSLATFSSLYRKRIATSKASLAPYFPPHTQRNVYLSLLHLPDHDPSSAKIPDSILRAALLARAVEDIHRIMEIRTRKQALATLLQKGIVGDEIWQRMLRAEQEMEIEVKDVVSEANALSNGTWGTTIFQSASEMASNAILRKKLEAIRETVPAEKKWWNEQRESSRRELTGETVVETAKPTAPVAAKAVKAGSSDEEAVLVETPAASGVDPTSSASGGKKKKKGKK